MRVTVTVKKNDKLWNKMVKNLNKSRHNVVEVGWWGNRHPTGEPVAQIAQWNDEGHMTSMGRMSPPRPFFKVGAMGKIKTTKLQKYVDMVNDIAFGKVTWAIMNRQLSKELEGIVKKEILTWSTPPNSPYTVDKKGFNDPLIWTGTMYDRVKTRVVRRAA